MDLIELAEKVRESRRKDQRRLITLSVLALLSVLAGIIHYKYRIEVELTPFAQKAISQFQFLFRN